MARDFELDQTFVHKTTTHECRIRWTRFGNTTSPAVIFVHGTPWSSIVWQNLAKTLSARYNIYVYDHPGFGQSPPLRRLTDTVDDKADLDEKKQLDAPLILRAEASAALFKHWNLASPPHVAAHDNGGLVSLRLLLQHDIKFASLCLIDVVTTGPSGLPFFKLVAENESVFAAVPPHLAAGFVRGYVTSATYTPMPKELEDTLSAPWLAGGTQGPEGFIREMIQAHYRDATDIENEYDRVSGLVSTKIIWGKDDSWLPVEKAHKLEKTIKAKELVIIEEAGHLIHYDQPSKLALEVGLWLGQNSKNET